MDERISDALRRWETIAVDDEIPDRLVLLDQLRDSRGAADFRDVDVLVIQHHLGTTVPLVRAFAEDGVPEDRIWHVDIPCSTNQVVRSALVALSGQDRCPPLFNDAETLGFKLTECILRAGHGTQCGPHGSCATADPPGRVVVVHGRREAA